MTLPSFFQKIKKNLASYLPSPVWPWEIVSGLLIIVLLINNIRNFFGENALDKVIIFSLVIIAVVLFWGLVDGLMFIFTSILQRGRYNKMAATIKSLDKKSAVKLITDELSQITILERLERGTKKQLVDTVYKKFVSGNLAVEKIRVSRDDIIGAFISVFFVFLPCTLVLPFFLLIPASGNLDFAILVSNVISLTLFFAFGYKLGSCTGRNKILTGVLIMAVGIIAILSGTILGA